MNKTVEILREMQYQRLRTIRYTILCEYPLLSGESRQTIYGHVPERSFEQIIGRIDRALEANDEN